MTTVLNIVERAALILNDSAYTRWAKASLLGWVNDGRRELANHQPQVYAATATVTAVAGAKQAIPSGGYKFLAVPRQTNKAAVTVTDKAILDRFCPDWMHGYYTTTPQHYMPHDTEPKAFWVYPPLRAGVSLDVQYLPYVTDLAEAGTLTATEEPFIPALVDYTVYRAISQDVEFGGNTQRAVAHYQAYLAAVGGATPS